MTNFAPTYTTRVQLQYLTLGRPHVMQFRLARGATAQQVGTAITAMRSALLVFQSQLYADFQFTWAQWCPEDSTTWIPITKPADIVGGQTVQNVPGWVRDSSFTVSGKGQLGSKCRLVVFGLNLSINWGGDAEDTLVTSTEFSALDDFIEAVQTAGIRAIDNTLGSWYPRATYHRNYRWERQSRRGR